MNLTERLYLASSRMMDAAAREEARIADTLLLESFCSKGCRLRFASDIRYHLVAGVANDQDHKVCEYCKCAIDPNKEDLFDPNEEEPNKEEPEVFEEEPDDDFDDAP